MKPDNKPRILTINGGSSSIKFAVFEVDGSLEQMLHGEIERIGLSGSTFKVKRLSDTDNFSKSVVAPDHSVAVGILLDWIEERFASDALTAIRVVDGGPKYSQPERITTEMILELHRASVHSIRNTCQRKILLIEAFRRRFPDLPQIACFDTDFHHDLPRVAKLLPIPRRYEAKGLRRYGFHGLSYSFLMEELNRIEGVKVRSRTDYSRPPGQRRKPLRRA